MQVKITTARTQEIGRWWKTYYVHLTALFLSLISVAAFVHYYYNGLGLAYSDARSHLDIGRRVVESLKPGLAQIGSVWLPLPHLLMTFTIWNDWMWHSGLSGALPSMVSYVVCGVLVMLYLRKLGVGYLGQVVGLLVMSLNLNLIYLQATAMTEPLLMSTMTAAAYAFLQWTQEDNILYLVLAAIWTMLSTLVRYDGWFLLLQLSALVFVLAIRKREKGAAEGLSIFFMTLAGFGVALWFLWNTVIFHDPLYFISGPYSARAQQKILEQNGKLPTKGNFSFSLYTYSLDTIYNVGIIPVILGLLGLLVLVADRKRPVAEKLAATALLTPFVFNVLALYLGQSVIFLQNITAETWFNVRYGLLTLPIIAVGIGYLVDRAKYYRPLLIAALSLIIFFSFSSNDAVTIEDGKVGSSQKNVYEISSWLHENAANQPGFILISASSHDAILFSSHLPMKRFIHEGTGVYWEQATKYPDRWARWIVMRTNDVNDNTFKMMQDNGQLFKYNKIESFPFADIYELKPQYFSYLNTLPTLKQED